jgi:hypothetical protein
MARRMTPLERQRRERAAQLATKIGCAAAARKNRLPQWAVYQMMGELGLKPPGVQPPAAERRRIAQLSQAEGVGAIAAREGVSVSAVKRYRQEHGLTGRLTHRQLFRIVADSKLGHSATSIASGHRIPCKTVYRILQLAHDEGLL